MKEKKNYNTCIKRISEIIVLDQSTVRMQELILKIKWECYIILPHLPGNMHFIKGVMC